MLLLPWPLRMLQMLLKEEPVNYWRRPLKMLNLPLWTLKTKTIILKLLKQIYMNQKLHYKMHQPNWKQPIIFSLMLNPKLLKQFKTSNLPWLPTLMPEMSTILLLKITLKQRNKFKKPETKKIKLITLLQMPNTLLELPIKLMIMLNQILQLPKVSMKKLTQLLIMPIL